MIPKARVITGRYGIIPVTGRWSTLPMDHRLYCVLSDEVRAGMTRDTYGVTTITRFHTFQTVHLSHTLLLDLTLWHPWPNRVDYLFLYFIFEFGRCCFCYLSDYININNRLTGIHKTFWINKSSSEMTCVWKVPPSSDKTVIPVSAGSVTNRPVAKRQSKPGVSLYLVKLYNIRY